MKSMFKNRLSNNRQNLFFRSRTSVYFSLISSKSQYTHDGFEIGCFAGERSLTRIEEPASSTAIARIAFHSVFTIR